MGIILRVNKRRKSSEMSKFKLQERAESNGSNRLEALSTRKKSLIGTNNYANPDDVVRCRKL